MGAPAIVAVPKGVDSAGDQIRRVLQQVIRGTIRFPIPMSSPSVITSVKGPDSHPSLNLAPSLPDALFVRQRAPWEGD
jgi:hypothetical protein